MLACPNSFQAVGQIARALGKPLSQPAFSAATRRLRLLFLSEASEMWGGE